MPSRVQANINKVSRALRYKGMMPLINQDQFYGDDGRAITKYTLHYGHPNPRRKDNDVIDICYGKVNLLKALIVILRAGDTDGNDTGVSNSHCENGKSVNKKNIKEDHIFSWCKHKEYEQMNLQLN